MENKEMKPKSLFVDEPCVATFFCGEVGWFIQRFQGFMRYIKTHKYQDHKFIILMNTGLHELVHDFVSYTIDLPDWFYDLKLETDCYEAPLPNSPAGSLTPPEVYAGLIEYLRNFYNPEKCIEIWPPRGCNYWIDNRPQLFKKLLPTKEIQSEKPIICVFPRGRTRAANRNVPEFIWNQVVNELKKAFTVVLSGTPSGSFLADYKDPDVINLIPNDKETKLEDTINYLAVAKCSISSQSGLTHVSLMSGCPSYIIGHENARHTQTENRFQTPTSFRYVADYRMIDANTIMIDVMNFLNALHKEQENEKKIYNEILAEDVELLKTNIRNKNGN
jgi:hypothetical protein